MLRVLIYLATTNSKSSLDIQKIPAKIKTDWRNQDSQIRSCTFCYLVKTKHIFNNLVYKSNTSLYLKQRLKTTSKLTVGKRSVFIYLP